MIRCAIRWPGFIRLFALVALPVLCAEPARARADTPAAEAPAPAQVATRRCERVLPAGVEGAVRRFTINGELVDDPEVVCGFLEPVMQENAAWGSDEQKAVEAFLTELGYASLLRRSGDSVEIDLQPVPLVRHVTVETKIGVIDRIVDPVFSEEIRRRMTLLPGSALDIDREKRAQQLQREEDRLAYYLRGEGFFETVVRIVEEPAGRLASRLSVVVDPGPPYTVGKITTVGNTAIPSNEITEIFHHERFGLLDRRFSREQLQRDVDQVVALYQKRGYPGVRVRSDFDMKQSFKRESKTVEFTIEIRERRKIDVVFEGIDKDQSTDELMNELTINTEGSYDDVELEQSAEALQRLYQRNGRFEASVTWERERFGVFERVVFAVDEGPRLPVREVILSGNKVLDDDEIYEVVKTRVFQQVIIGESGGYLTSTQLAQDVERILELYRSKGYIEARVAPRVARSRRLLGNAAALAAAVAAEQPAEGLYVLFQIEEGPLIRVDHLTFEFVGEHALTARDLVPVLAVKPGAPLVREQLQADANQIGRFYFSRGYPRAKVGADIVKGRDPGSREVRYRIQENSPATIGKTALRGNFKTRSWVLEDEMQLHEGQPLTLERAERAQANLRSSGLFSAVRIDYKGFDKENQQVVNVLASVNERHDNAGEISAGFGYATDTKLFAEVGYGFQNIGGIGARFDLRGLLGQERQLIEGKLAFPRWITRRVVGVPFLLELTSFYQVEKTQRFGDLTSIGTSVAATIEGRPRTFFEGWFLSLRYDFRRRNRDEELVRVAGASDDIDKSKIVTVASAIGPQLVIDKRRDQQGRRNPLAPTAGFRLEGRVSFNENYLVGSDRFIKVGASGQHFLALGDRFLISNGLRFDQGFPLDGAVVLPEVERFFAGGDTTVRGFEEDRLATELVEEVSPPLGMVPQFRVVPAGGNIRMIHNLELQVRLSEWRFPVASAIFLDSGLVTNSFEGVRFKDLRHGLGLALFRLVLPFGSLSIEYAIPLDPTVGDNPQGRFHINLGLLF